MRAGGEWRGEVHMNTYMVCVYGKDLRVYTLDEYHWEADDLNWDRAANVQADSPLWAVYIAAKEGLI
jgi:hypothetical protein